jgi:hypothetical protein
LPGKVSILSPMPQGLTCFICKDTIGVYEPLVVLKNFNVSRTSLAVEPAAADGADAVFHGSCVPTLRITRPADQNVSSSHR